jgi:AcrR family transcriptional regulator
MDRSHADAKIAKPLFEQGVSRMTGSAKPRKVAVDPAKRPQQERGVLRYNKLLDAAHALLTEHDLEEIGLYQIAEHAEVPPASAYHFFPTPGAVFLALTDRYHERFADLTLNLDMPEDGRWQTLLKLRLAAAARVFNESLPMRKLLLGGYTTRDLVLSEAEFNERMASEMAGAYDKFFNMPPIRDVQRKYLVVLTLVDAIWRLSYARHRAISPAYMREAELVAVSYCRTFLPEVIERREVLRGAEPGPHDEL